MRYWAALRPVLWPFAVIAPILRTSYLSGLLLLTFSRVVIDARRLVDLSQFRLSTVQGQEREWSVGEKIGSGGFGQVHLVKSSGLGLYVAKFIPKAPGADRELLFQELTDLENIVPVVDSGESDNHWIIVMPKADKSLADLLLSPDDPPSISTARDILADIAKALVSMKGRVVHRDIKPANILLLDDHWCLADFGISRYAEATTAADTRKFARTAPYAAPEQWRHIRATNATDVYSFGVVAYQLFAGKLPFPGPDPDDYRRQHLDELPESIAGIPLADASLVYNCMVKAPDARPSPETILSRLMHSPQSQSAAEGHLQAGNALVVRRRLEQDRRKSAEQSERQRKEELYQAAEQSFNGIITLLAQRIQDCAPASTISGNGSSGWRITLGKATLSVAPVSKTGRIVTWDDKHRKIVAFSEIVLRTLRDRYGHEGISHSLWYLRQSDSEGFRWYELAFKTNPIYGRRSPLDPYSLPPDSQDVGLALSQGVVHTISLAEPPTPIDQGDEEGFIERWISRFAEVVNSA